MSFTTDEGKVAVGTTGDAPYRNHWCVVTARPIGVTAVMDGGVVVASGVTTSKVGVSAATVKVALTNGVGVTAAAAVKG
ncbi:MAG: hypothetical protein R2932_30820 [Caldilineaceae bacterium]